MSETEGKTNGRRPILPTFIGGIAALLIFLLILFVAYLPNRGEAVGARKKEQRLEHLRETRASQTDRITGYDVVNAKKGVVRIPVERAMELTVEDYAGAPRTSGE